MGTAAMTPDLPAIFVEMVLQRDAEMRARLENGMAEAINRMTRHIVPRLARRTMTKRGFRRWRARIWPHAKP